MSGQTSMVIKSVSLLHLRRHENFQKNLLRARGTTKSLKIHEIVTFYAFSGKLTKLYVNVTSLCDTGFSIQNQQ
jgi:hypothetical protein